LQQAALLPAAAAPDPYIDSRKACCFATSAGHGLGVEDVFVHEGLADEFVTGGRVDVISALEVVEAVVEEGGVRHGTAKESSGSWGTDVDIG